MSRLKTKEEIECQFHKFTNNIFMDKLPSGLQNVLSSPHLVKRINEKIIEYIINPINKEAKLGFNDKSLGIPKLMRIKDAYGKNVKKRVVDFVNSDANYITNLVDDECKQLLIAVNPSDEFKAKHPEVKEIINRLNMLDFKNISGNLSKIDSKYSIVILDNTANETLKISATYRSDQFLCFFRTNKLTDETSVEEFIMPVYLLNHNAPENSSFIFNRHEINSISSKIESVMTIPQVTSKTESSETPIVDLTTEESKAEDKVEDKAELKDTSTKEDKSQVTPKEIRELSNLESNPYDKNQYLRVISFKEIPEKTFLQGRAKPDIKTTSYNLYENKDDNKLVGVLQFKETGYKVIVNVKWCLNYTPN